MSWVHCLVIPNFKKHFSNELAPVPLDVYNSQGKKFCTIGAASRTGIIYLPYKKKIITEIANYRPISLLNLDYKAYTNYFELNAKRHLATIICEHQSEDSKVRIIL